MVSRVIPVDVFDLVIFGGTGDLARRIQFRQALAEIPRVLVQTGAQHLIGTGFECGLWRG